jgi:hypothetical protein
LCGKEITITATGEIEVAKKKSAKDLPKRYGTLIRVSDKFAESIRRASSFEKASIAEYAETHLLPVIERRYRDAVLKEAKKMEGKP